VGYSPSPTYILTQSSRADAELVDEDDGEEQDDTKGDVSMTEIDLPAPAPTRQNAEETFSSEHPIEDLSRLLLVCLASAVHTKLTCHLCRSEKNSAICKGPFSGECKPEWHGAKVSASSSALQF
jgi:hypothetical protein